LTKPLQRQADHLPHREDQDRRRQCHADPKATRHIDEFRILLFFQRHRHRLERHAADRAIAGALLHDLRVHRADVGACALDNSGRLPMSAMLAAQVARRASLEFVPAPGAAEIVILAAMFVPMLGSLGHCHAAHGILQSTSFFDHRRPILWIARNI